MRGFLALLGGDDRHRTSPTWAAPGVRVEVGDGAAFAQHGPLVAVADLRLDNRAEVRERLGAAPEADDAGLLLAAYRAWGPDLVDHLDGPFAFVVWDGRDRRATFARDALGLRPLYRARVGRTLLLGTDLSELRAHVPTDLCAEAVADHLAGTFAHPWRTAFAAVERVPPAHLGVVRPEVVADVRTRRFWSPDPSRTRRLGDEGAERAFREAFDRSVARRLGGDPAAFLSGGLDSSSIVVTAHALRPEAVPPTLSIVYDAPVADERRFVEAVFGVTGARSHRIEGASLSLLGGLDADLNAVGEPFFTPNLFLTRSLYAEAARLGHAAVLDGFAGDSVVFHGEQRLSELAWRLRWPTFLREVRAVAARTSHPRRTALRLVRDYALAPLVRRPARPGLTFAHPDLPRPEAETLPPRTVRAAHHAEMAAPFLSRAVEVAHASAASFGVAPRYPFLDRRLVELCLSLPPEQRLRDGLTRSVLRRAMAGRLPDILRDRPGKARLGGLFVEALFDREPETLRRLVHEDAPRAADLLDVRALLTAYERARAHPEARDTVALPLWRAVTLARWRTLNP